MSPKAPTGERGIFTPELLAPEIYYARTFKDVNGAMAEESDRWQQSLVLTALARDWFASA